MSSHEPERRIDRSQIRVEAVRKQLERAAADGGFDLLVLADEGGSLIGGAGGGKAHDPEEVAAFAGHLADIRRILSKHLHVYDTEEIRVIRAIGRELVCRFFRFRSTGLVLIAFARDSEPSREHLDRAVTGVQRILEAKDLELDG
jgi:hypothetical protein